MFKPFVCHGRGWFVVAWRFVMLELDVTSWALAAGVAGLSGRPALVVQFGPFVASVAATREYSEALR